jgi:hypothetical protein
MPTIFDIDQLRPLEDLPDLGLTLQGGTAFRFLLHDLRDDYRRKSVDLFDLTPFTADVDLYHRASDEDTRKIRAFVMDNVPHADCFRWEIHSHREHSGYSEAARFSPTIPARSVAISRGGIVDPHGGIDDIKRRRFRYLRNHLYHRSPLFKSGQDLEFFSVFLYLQTIFEADLSLSEAAYQDGLFQASDVVFDAIKNDALRIAEWNPYLKARATYLLVNCLAAAQDSQFWPLARASQLDVLLRLIAASKLPLSTDLREYLMAGGKRPRPTLSASSYLRNRWEFRLPDSDPGWRREGATEQFLRGSFGLAPGQNVLMASSILRLREGIARSNPEFFYFEIPKVAKRYKDEDISALMLARRLAEEEESTKDWEIFALPCVAQRRGIGRSDRVSVRINAMDLFQFEDNDYESTTEVQFFLIGLDPRGPR